MNFAVTRFNWVFVCILLSVAAVGRAEEKAVAPPAQQPVAPAADEPAAQPAQNGPEFKFETDQHDFGQVSPGTKHEFVFRFRNVGNETLRITNIHAPCGCTIPTLEKLEFAPGEEGKIPVTYVAVTSRQPVINHIHITSNDRNKPEYTLFLKAVSVPRVNIEPETFQLSLRSENAGLGTITLTSTDGRPFAIKNFRAPGGSITADFDPTVEATSFRLSPKADIDKLRMNLTGNITIELTHPEAASVEARYVTRAEFETRPAVFHLQSAEVGKPETRELWVINNYNDNFDIESITSERDSIKVVSREDRGNKYLITLEITVPAGGGAPRFFIDNLLVKIKDGPTLRVRCSAWIRQAPADTAAR